MTETKHHDLPAPGFSDEEWDEVRSIIDDAWARFYDEGGSVDKFAQAIGWLVLVGYLGRDAVKIAQFHRYWKQHNDTVGGALVSFGPPRTTASRAMLGIRWLDRWRTWRARDNPDARYSVIEARELVPDKPDRLPFDA